MLVRWVRRASASMRRTPPRHSPVQHVPALPVDGGTFTTGTGSRPYKLFVPEGFKGKRMPLVMMLQPAQGTLFQTSSTKPCPLLVDT